MEEEKSEQQKLNYYKQIAKRSFETVFNQYLFFRVSRAKQDIIGCNDFRTFEPNQEIIDEYVNEYWQKDYVFKKEGEWSLRIKDIETDIYKWQKKAENKQITKECEDFYIKNIFQKNYSFEEFTKTLNIKTCFYCGISEEQIKELIANNKIFKKKVTRGWTLEIDRKKPNLEYTHNNCVRCCYWCNSAKTDEFDDVEFKPIGEAIKQIWNARRNS